MGRGTRVAGRRCRDEIGVVASKYLVEEVDVPRGQLQRLDLAEFVRRKGGYDATQLRERVVQGLRPLSLADVRQGPLVMHVPSAAARKAELTSTAVAVAAAAAAGSDVVFVGVAGFGTFPVALVL